AQKRMIAAHAQVRARGVPRPWGLCAVLFLVLALLIGLGVGAIEIGPGAIVRSALAHLGLGVHSPLSSVEDAILWQLRAPRVVLAALVGAMLAVAGASYQGVFRNPLADPYLLGVAAGAGLGATIAVVYLPRGYDFQTVLPPAAFVGGSVAVVAAYAIGRSAGRGSGGATLVLAGVMSGLVGFVGIIVPHAIRLVAGPSYRMLLPLSVLLGASFLVLADVIARTALSPAELPIGVVTAFFGAPFFAIVLRTSRRML